MNKRLSVGCEMSDVRGGLQRCIATGLKTGITAGITMASVWLGMGAIAQALPGQTVHEAEAWMQAHPSLRALPTEGISIRRNDTPSSRFTFHGSVFGPSGGSGESLLIRRSSGEVISIRSEKFTLVDIVRGVSIPRLEDSLRTIYGAEVFADYRRAQAVIVYSPGRPEDRGTERAHRAQLLEGELYAYLIEEIPNTNGVVETGAVTVMLREDVPAIREGLYNREVQRRERENPSGRSIHHRTDGATLRELLE
ncbi:MAG: hypothetical protein AAF810_10980 [Cyanobacteria bacterium P01_D01_bin.36]